MDERVFFEWREMIGEQRPVVFIDDSEWYPVAPFGGGFEGVFPVGGVVFRGQDVAPFFIPGEGVEAVEGDAWLYDIQERETGVGDGGAEEFGEVFHHSGESAGHEAGFHGGGREHGIEGSGGRSEGLGLGLESFFGGGAGLSFGKSVNLVVVDEEGEVNIPADGGQEVISALAVVASVSAFHDHGEFGVGGFGAGGHRQ